MSGVVVAVGLLGCGGPEMERDPVDTISQMDQEIVGGFEARPHSFPWIVSLQQGTSHFCGGALVRVSAKEESDIVLTAAHCFYRGRSGVTAAAGAHDLRSPTAAQATVRVVRAVLHPQFNPDTTMNDIAVLKLERSIKFDQAVAGACGQSSTVRPNTAPQYASGGKRSPVCLPPSGDLVPDNTMATVAGWGRKEEAENTSPILLQVGVPILNHEYVAKRYSYGSHEITINRQAMFGAGYEVGGKDACQGDSGGPLIVPGPHGYVIQGIVSFAEGCAREGKPGIYTRVSNYIPWINTQIRTYSSVR
ncbi:serine protease [Myxococcus virescens]|uniref:serine protease n=1 Tax=Myxococcus virescens TaxID=83456 RepID=UPI003DA51ABF